MKNKKLLISIVIAILVLVAIIAVYFAFKGENKDGRKFKEEYESLNGVINPNNDKIYPNLSISANNSVVYSSYEEILDILDKGTGVIYFGYPECPWCRNLVPVLLEVVKDTPIYYMNMRNERDEKAFNSETGRIETTKKAKQGYYDLLDRLDKYLSEYTITKDEEKYNTGEKRIYVPLVVFVKDGSVVGVHADTVESQEDPYIKLDNKQKEELKDILSDLLNKMNTCDVNDQGC